MSRRVVRTIVVALALLGAALLGAGAPSPPPGPPPAAATPLPAMPPVPPTPPTPPTPPKQSRHGDAWVVLMVLREEVLARDPAAAVPTPAQIDAADRSGGLESPVARDALAVLARESDRLAIDFPRALRRP